MRKRMSAATQVILRVDVLEGRLEADGEDAEAEQERRAELVEHLGRKSEIPNFEGSYLGRFPLVSADFWTIDHLSERSRRVDAFSETRARGTLTLKRR